MGSGASKKEKSSKSYLLQTFEEHEGSINCMEVSDDGSVLATGSDDAHIRLWSTKTDVIECIGVLEGHDDYITCLDIEDSYLLSASADKTIRKWDMSTCECVLVFLGHESTVNKLVCTGDFVFSVSYDKKARCWDYDTGECVRIFSGHKNNINSILFIPADKENLTDALKFVQAHAAKKNLAASGNRLPPISKMAAIKNANMDITNEEDEIDEIYSKDLIITGSLDSTAKSWSIETGECVQTFKGHSAAITCLATDPLGKLLFTGSADHSIKSWEIMTGQLLKTFAGHQTTVISLLAHRKLLFSTSSDHTARCWVMEFGDCTRIYKEHGHSVSTIIENNGLVYTGCGDGNARCFDSKSGALKRTFKGHTGAVNCLRIVDNRLFTGSFDGTLRAWDLHELSADKGNGAANAKEKNNAQSYDHQGRESMEMKSQRAGQKMMIENEKNYYSSPQANPYSNYNKSMDQRSEADSGFDDRDYAERYNNNLRQGQPRRLQVKEMV